VESTNSLRVRRRK